MKLPIVEQSSNNVEAQIGNNRSKDEKENKLLKNINIFP